MQRWNNFCPKCVYLGTVKPGDGLIRDVHRCTLSGRLHYLAKHGPLSHDAITIPADCLLNLSGIQENDTILRVLHLVCFLDQLSPGGLAQGFALVQSRPGQPVALIISPFLTQDESIAVFNASNRAQQGRLPPETDEELLSLEGGVLAELVRYSQANLSTRWRNPVVA